MAIDIPANGSMERNMGTANLPMQMVANMLESFTTMPAMETVVCIGHRAMYLLVNFRMMNEQVL
jgi:hypothetical protein